MSLKKTYVILLLSPISQMLLLRFREIYQLAQRQTAIMDKEDNLCDTNSFKTSWSRQSLFPKVQRTVKWGRRQGNIYGMKNKEQEVRIEPGTALVFVDWLTRYAVKQSIHRDTNII